MEDVLDILQENRLSFSIFDYHSQTFGLWMNNGYTDRKNTEYKGENTIGKLNKVAWDLYSEIINVEHTIEPDYDGIGDDKGFYITLYNLIYKYLGTVEL